MSANLSDLPFNGSQLSTSAPELSPTEAAKIAARCYGIDGTAELLTSERDSNFRLGATDGSTYLLKVSNPSEAEDIVDLQTACLDHIAGVDPTLPVPRVLRTREGAKRGQTVLADRRRCTVRLLTYLAGVPAKGTPRSRTQRIQIGAVLAELDIALRGFTHRAAVHDLLWNVSRADRLTHLVDEISGGGRRKLVRHFMDCFLADTLPRLGGLRAQVIHNDFNLYNVLVATADTDRVTGVIDFGDLVHAPLVGEVATAAAFQMAQTDDPMAAAAEFVGAYHAVLPLLPEEQEIFADLVATRHLITVLISEWRSRRYPENHAYIMRHNAGAWDGLHLMAGFSRQDARDRMLDGVRSGDDR
ncbi:phosphotransferase [Flavisphingomonas formosensis]|uniref:phosphotransferase n=1 Tax=Flavisphingomonas formosensis TaxID=861534 RepID=UPI0012FCA508|nr:phosphotransferase [Sphingomonas formosensis]